MLNFKTYVDGTRASTTLLAASWRMPFARVLSSLHPVVLIYHGVPRKNDAKSINGILFERHVMFLRSHFEFISPDQLQETRNPLGKIRVLLTFDDGFRNHAEVAAPVLRKYHVPAVFFVCSRHSSPGKYLWFAYLRALEDHFPKQQLYFRGQSFDMSPAKRLSSIERLRGLLLNLNPHPHAMYEAIERELPALQEFLDDRQVDDRYAGMTSDQVAELARDPLFAVGVHTLDHPFLTRCEASESFRQICQNKTWIEKITGRRCNSIAYPSGDYDLQILRQCSDLGLIHGHAQTPVLGTHPRQELPRIGVYSTSVHVLGFKVQWGNLMRAMKLRVG